MRFKKHLQSWCFITTIVVVVVVIFLLLLFGGHWPIILKHLVQARISRTCVLSPG